MSIEEKKKKREKERKEGTEEGGRRKIRKSSNEKNEKDWVQAKEKGGKRLIKQTYGSETYNKKKIMKIMIIMISIIIVYTDLPIHINQSSYDPLSGVKIIGPAQWKFGSRKITLNRTLFLPLWYS